jgi:hypothetical protein
VAVEAAVLLFLHIQRVQVELEAVVLVLLVAGLLVRLAQLI